MIEKLLELQKNIIDDPLFISLEISSVHGTEVHCFAEYMFGRSDLSVEDHGGPYYDYKISRKVEGITFMALVTALELRELFPHLAKEVIKCPNCPA